MGGAQDYAPPNTAKRDPELRMLKMSNRPEKNNKNYVFPVNREHFGISTKQPRQYARCASNEQREHISKNKIVNGMISKICQRRKDFSGVMQLVELPQKCDSMFKVVINPISYFISQEQD